MKKVLITGANGQLGKCLQDAVSANPIEGFQFLFCDRTQLDISQKEVVETFFFSNKIDICVNCAAYTAVDLAETETELAFKVNSDAVKFLAEECKEQNATLIHVSTDYVFDGNSNAPYTPADQTNPINVYGKSKLDGEKWALGTNPQTIVIRTSWVYSQYGKNFYTTMLRLMKERDELNIVSDQIGKPTNANDLAKYILEIISSNDTNYGIRNYSGNEIMSWYDFAKKIAVENGLSTNINPIPTSAYPTPAKRPMWSVLE
ncbi:dTDP-4-dehydrorhamnose reductase [Moheibacter sediminis]|uniref:dTDP-4-dehydrorhamnose reductase n=1 Tax=Moheibacter sediminis TaxID=1434700 RepID=A0A1W1YAZ8_9FLAO|nr:dTDP-4-dehydrorhamnose reductase [Moheibacter sediminis]SMC33336.1 dTDP-4-dehydrorhamnose reductase [Moheibacter sediminis]